ncbi:MAG: hypothetical protein IJY90_03200 [Clostridia bacterium]|nr:hypothetical protein [Clostridia bacterium]
MKNKYVLAFDIGSSRLRAMVAGKGLNNTFAVKGYKEIEYDGFYEGEFLNPDKLLAVFSEVIKEFQPYLDKIKKMYIGVPAEFSSVAVTDMSINLGERRRVKKDDIDSLYYMAGETSKNAEVEVVSVSPISFDIDGRTTLEPVGDFGTNLCGKLSVIYASKVFIDLFNDVAAQLGFQYVEYISDVLAQAQFILPKEKQDEVSLLIDAGDITTSIAFVQGNGVSALTSFSRGGGFITNDLSEAFELSIKDAEKLKKQVVLSVKGKPTDCYEIPGEAGNMERIMQSFANEVVAYRIDELAEVVSKCIQDFSDEHLSYLPIYLTGGGISKIKGGRDYLAKCLGRNITLGVPPLPGQEKPTLASIYSLVAYAINAQDTK